MGYSEYLDVELLDHWLGGVDYTRPATVYASLHTATPGKTGANELGTGTWTNYARLSITNNSTNWPGATIVSAKGQKQNGAIFTWPTVTASGTVVVTHCGLWDAVSAGNFLGGGALASSKTIGNGDEVKFPIGTFTVTLD